MTGAREIIEAHHLVGCRYRLVQSRRFPDAEPTDAAKARAQRLAAGRQVVYDLLPFRPALGDGRRKRFVRCDLGTLPADDPEQREFDTLEALATEAELIVGAVLAGSEGNWRVEVDALVRVPGGYMPVIVSNHRVARKKEGARTPVISTARAGLSDPLEAPYKLRYRVADGYRLGLAARALAAMDLDSGRAGLIGQDRRRIFVTDPARFQPALSAALEAVEPENLPEGPRRVKECATCRFWPVCREELEAADDISLFLPGDRADALRAAGITTVSQLIAARDHATSPHPRRLVGHYPELAAAWRAGIPLLAKSRPSAEDIPAADVEIDIDMEAYLDQGAYLWGAFDGSEYIPFATWEPLGGRAEAEVFAQFWHYLSERRRKASQDGHTFAVFCYSAHGENHWMRMSAQRFAGQAGIPSVQEVNEFIASDEWVDVFVYVRRFLTDTAGLGLKVVAPQAGFSWPEEEFDGEESINARRIAIGDSAQAEAFRRRIVEYNRGDCQANRVVRSWLRSGVPGLKLLGR